MLSFLLDLSTTLVSPLVQMSLLDCDGVHLLTGHTGIHLLRLRHVGLDIVANRHDSLH